MLLLKLLLTPLLIGAVTLIGRRWGPRAAGLVVGLPLTTGPISLFLATERGPAFALRAAGGAMTGLVGTGAFCAAFAVIVRRREWPAALAGALVTLAAITLVESAVETTPRSLPMIAALAVAALVLLWAGASRLTATVHHERPRRAPQAAVPAWDLPARVIVSTAMVAAVTAGAGALGSRWSGVLSALPVFGAVLGVFTHRQEGRGAAIALMRGLIIGCVSGVLFFTVVGELLAPDRLAATYGAAALIAVVSGALVSRLTRPRAHREEPAANALPVRMAA